VWHSYFINMLLGVWGIPNEKSIVHLRSKCSMGDFSLLYKSSKV